MNSKGKNNADYRLENNVWVVVGNFAMLKIDFFNNMWDLANKKKKKSTTATSLGKIALMIFFL